ncbi:efflux RND transporter permease subunit [Mucilaginibacter sp. BJC16-A38]|uniref:efflux RND transporter permease subunit n=1 Tax=Mucilaginibacter phenanthrenivorans TaxID=1234842 RepID=UPI00215849B3|nr:efflux RND transporter permease subunit [Mucilaginibacter phenanthrenivorans]MCR8561065.1 efflux RND transporter permease subunit [Mucilaginibacter phenanthrenivorans]
MNSDFRIVGLFALLSVLSLFTIPKLNVSLTPEHQEEKELTISFNVQDSSPEETEQQVTSLLENIFSTLKDIKKITSVSRYNNGSIQLYFSKGDDISLKRFEILQLLRQIKPSLPEYVSFPTVSLGEVGDAEQYETPVLTFNLNGTGTAADLKTLAENTIKRRVINIPGVKEVDISGAQDPEILISYDLRKLTAYKIDVPDILRALQFGTETLFPGKINYNHQEIFLKSNGPPVDIERLKHIEINNPASGSNSELEDLATITLKEQDPQGYFRINGQNAINISVYPQKGINTIYLADNVKQEITEINSQLGNSYKITVEHDDTVFLKKEVNKNYRRALFTLIILLLFLLVSYRNWKHLLVLFLSLFVNLSLTVLLAWVFKISIHIYSLAGIAVAFGIMIDHAIIMLDYFRQFKNRKVILSLFAATLCSISAMISVNLLPVEERRDLKDFAIIIIIALGISIVTNLWFTIGIHNLLFDRHGVSQQPPKFPRLRKIIKFQNIYYKSIANMADFRRVILIILILIFGLPLFLLPEKIEGANFYNRSVGSFFNDNDFGVGIAKYIGGTFRLFKINVYEHSTYTDLGKTKLIVHAELPIGNSVQQMDVIIRSLEGYLKQAVGIDQFITHIYSGQFGIIEITFKDKMDSGPFPYNLKSSLTDKALDWDGINWQIYGVGLGFSNVEREENPSFRFTMMGYNFDELQHQADLFKLKLLQHKRIKKVLTDDHFDLLDKKGHEFVLNISQEKLLATGTSTGELFRSLQIMAKRQGSNSSLLINSKFYPVIIQSDSAESYSKWDILNSSISIGSKNQTRLNNFSKIDFVETSGAIHKENRQYVRNIAVEYLGTPQFGFDFLNDKLKEMQNELPIGYSIKLDDSHWSNNSLAIWSLVISSYLVVIYLICSILFENLFQGVIIVSTIPISFIGLFLIFYISDCPFDQGGYCAFIMIASLVVNAGIFVINDFNNLKRKRIDNNNHNRNLIKAVIYRGKTIILTTLAAICGMLPFLLEGQNEIFWFSLAVGTIGGLIISLFAIFMAMPIFLWNKSSSSFSVIKS